MAETRLQGDPSPGDVQLWGGSSAVQCPEQVACVLPDQHPGRLSTEDSTDFLGVGWQVLTGTLCGGRETSNRV
jgi:hypothetical protein